MSSAVELREPHGYLSSLVTDETSCGAFESPWWLAAKPGQRLRLYLLDFSSNDVARSSGTTGGGPGGLDVAGDGGRSGGRGGAGGGAPICHVFAVVKEETGRPSETICSTDERRTVVFTSLTNLVEVRLIGNKRIQQASTKENQIYFLVEYEGLSWKFHSQCMFNGNSVSF